MNTPRNNGMNPFLLRSLALLAAASLFVFSTTGLFAGTAHAEGDTKALAPYIDIMPVTSTVITGGTLLYKIQIYDNNKQAQDLVNTQVTITYNPNKLRLVNSMLRGPRDYVSDVGKGTATVSFGRIGAQRERSATLEFQVNQNLADSQPISTAGSFRWQTVDMSDTGKLVVPVVYVQNPNVAAQATMVPSAGPAGTLAQVTANRFQGGEQVVTWLNTRTSVQPSSVTAQADGAGNVQFTFNTWGLNPDNYSLVVYGRSSGREYVVPFIVTPTPTSGPAGTIFPLTANGYQAGEQVVTWLNTPSGVQPFSLTGQANDDGDVQLRLNSSGLAPGAYGLVVHGLSSGYEVVWLFMITAP